MATDLERFAVSYQDYFKDYQTAKAMGAAMLACNAMLVPEARPDLALLIKSFPRFISTLNDPAEVNYAGGLQSSVPSVPKTLHEGAISVIETDTGKGMEFAEWITLVGETDFLLYDGRIDRAMRVHRYYGCKVTLDVGEIDSESRSQILMMNGTLKGHYFGKVAELGKTSNPDIKMHATNKMFEGFAKTAKTVLGNILQGNSIIGATKQDWKIYL